MYEKLPEQLKKDGHFCLWKYEERNGRMTKVPYQTNGKRASSADKNTFSDFRLAASAMNGYDGIGMGAFDDFCMVDIDHCVFGGKLTQMAEDVVGKMDSYTEFSPSGTESALYVRHLPCLMIRADIGQRLWELRVLSLMRIQISEY